MPCSLAGAAGDRSVCSRSGPGELSARSPARDAPGTHAPHWDQLAIPVAGVGWDLFHTNPTHGPVRAAVGLT